jgi:hypothetical protein
MEKCCLRVMNYIFMRRDLDLKRGTPRPGLEPGSKDPQSSRMSTTPPGH